MDIHPSEIVIAIRSVQSMAALVLAALLLYFFHSFRHAFLQHWAFSTLALAVYLGFSAAASGLYRAGPGYDLLRLLCSAVSLGAVYPHVVWLMIGTWEAVRQRVVSRRLEIALVGAAALVGVFSASLGALDAPAGDVWTLLRVELRYALTGLAFLVAGLLLWRAQRTSGLVGARIGSIGFCLFGLQMLHVLGINLAIRAGYPPPFYASYSGLLDFLFQSVIGLGIVVWLLELQQQRTRRAHKELQHVRRHDPTTGLPNRAMLVEQLDAMIDRTGVRRVAVVSLGVNRYAMLNQALGWQRTEQIIAEAAQRFHEAINQRCALGRVSDRDFVIARPTLDDPASIESWAESLLARALRSVDSDGQEIFVTFCAGISIYPDDAVTPETLLQHSKDALVQSARIGRALTLYQQIDQHDQGRFDTALQFESELRRGLSEKRFELFYQPLVRVADRRVAGFEALLRWRHPRRGVLRPEAFIDEAASIGVLDELESLALTSALKQLARWSRQGRTELMIAVNVSAQCFQRDDLVERVVQACKRHAVSPDRLELEITENTALRDLPHAARQIDALHREGVGVALDDFGTGYSSLANLVKLPVDRIKLDREFLRGVLRDQRQRDLVAAMIALGHRLGLEVVAEGVESTAQFEFLVEHGCDLAQGYLLQKPASPQECAFGSIRLPD